MIKIVMKERRECGTDRWTEAIKFEEKKEKLK